MNTSAGLAALAATVALASIAAASTLTVGPPGSGAGFTDIQAAISAAAPGDVILVQPGSYQAFLVDKPVRVLGAGAGLVLVTNSVQSSPYLCLRVTSIPSGSTAEVSGMSLLGTPLSLAFVPGAPTVLVDQCQGTVLLHGLDVRQSLLTTGFAAGPSESLRIQDSAWVLLQDSIAWGGLTAGVTSPAVGAQGSTVWIESCALRGGAADLSTNGYAGAAAMRATDSVVYAARSSFRGGNGASFLGTCIGGPTFLGAPGGAGLVLGAASTAKLVGGPGSLFAGGSGTCGTSFCPAKGGAGIFVGDGCLALVADQNAMAIVPGAGCATLPDELPISVQGQGKVYTVPTHYPTLALLPPAAPPGAGVTVALDGAPSANGALFFSLALQGPLELPGFDGAIALDVSGAALLLAFALDGAGTSSPSFGVPPSPSLSGTLVSLQWIELAALPRLSNPASLAILP